MNKHRLASIVVIGVVILFILISDRLQLYKDYQDTMDRTEMIRAFASNQETIRYDQPLPYHSHSYDEHLFFSLDENYSIVYEGEVGVEYGLGPNYKIGPDAKAIGIFKIGVPIDQQFTNLIAQNPSLNEETVSSILQPYSFQHDIDAFLYVVDQSAQQKLSFFSSKDALRRETVLNCAAEQFMQSYFLAEDALPTFTRLSGNVDGLEIIDRMYQLTNGQHAYLMLFTNSYTDEEVEQIMQTVTIR